MYNIDSKEFKRRLKYALNIRGVSASDLSKLTGISKPLISNYLSGDYKPKQDKLYSISECLKVNPVWLMGLDIPMETSELKEIKLNANVTLRIKPGAKISDEDIDFIKKYIDVKYGENKNE